MRRIIKRKTYNGWRITISKSNRELFPFDWNAVPVRISAKRQLSRIHRSLKGISAATTYKRIETALDQAKCMVNEIRRPRFW